MSSNWLDRLARDVARGMTRREAVRVLAGTAAAAAFAPLMRAGGVVSARGIAPDDKGCSGTRTFFVPGCKKPVPKLNYEAPINGCGPEGGVFGTGINAVPNRPLFLANFRPACNTHDVGYSTCNRPKEDTDWKFLVDMNAICNDEYPSTGLFDSILRSDCKFSATTFYMAVKDGGADAYKAGQADACDCCDECPPRRSPPPPSQCPNSCPAGYGVCCVQIKYGFHNGGCCSAGQECCIGSNNAQDHPNMMSWCCQKGRCGDAGKCLTKPCAAA